MDSVENLMCFLKKKTLKDSFWAAEDGRDWFPYKDFIGDWLFGADALPPQGGGGGRD
jgi:hypothetical protein